MKKNLSAIVMSLLFLNLACNNVETPVSEGALKPNLQTFSDENIMFEDAVVRSLNSKEYVKELHFKNFSEETFPVNSTIYKGQQFMDDGIGNDKTANDGIFTSLNAYKFDEKVKFDNSKPTQSFLTNPIISPNFKQYEKLKKFKSHLRPNGVQTFEVTCKIVWTGGGCRACDWWGGSHCNWCFSVEECNVTIGF